MYSLDYMEGKNRRVFEDEMFDQSLKSLALWIQVYINGRSLSLIGCLDLLVLVDVGSGFILVAHLFFLFFYRYGCPSFLFYCFCSLYASCLLSELLCPFNTFSYIL